MYMQTHICNNNRRKGHHEFGGEVGGVCERVCGKEKEKEKCNAIKLQSQKQTNKNNTDIVSISRVIVWIK